MQLKRVEIDEKYLSRFKYLIRSETNQKLIFNPDKEKDGYMPTVTIIKRIGINGWYTERIEIQFSCPAIVYGTNYYGIDENDREKIADMLYEKLCRIFNGQPTTREHLLVADLRVTAFAFNFTLPAKFGYPIEYIKVVPSLDIGKNYKRIKANCYDEETFGFCARIFNTQSGLRVYDKGAQTINTAKTAEEKEVVTKMKQGILPDKLIRIELTYQNRTSLKKRLSSRLGGAVTQERHLFEVLDNKLCQSILLEAFDELFNPINMQAFDFPLFSPNQSYAIARKSGMTMYDAWALIGRSALITQTGSGQLKLISDNYYDRRDRSLNDKRLTKIINATPLPSFTFKQVIAECRKQLVEFNVMRPEHFNQGCPMDKQNHSGIIE